MFYTGLLAYKAADRIIFSLFASCWILYVGILTSSKQKIMEKIHVHIVFVLLQVLMFNPTFAQKKNAIKFNLLSPIAKTLSFSYERDISVVTSVLVLQPPLCLDVSYLRFLTVKPRKKVEYE
jgi:hypothetical protein